MIEHKKCLLCVPKALGTKKPRTAIMPYFDDIDVYHRNIGESSILMKRKLKKYDAIVFDSHDIVTVCDSIKDLPKRIKIYIVYWKTPDGRRVFRNCSSSDDELEFLTLVEITSSNYEEVFDQLTKKSKTNKLKKIAR